MRKEHLIVAIREYNRSASAQFLADFSVEELQQYLQRLTQLVNQRGRDSVWVRPLPGDRIASAA